MAMVLNRRLAVVLVAVFIAAAIGLVAVALPGLNQVATTTAATKLPAGCIKPAGGFLIVASLQGYNDSIDHGVPANNWPVMDAKLGQNVTIVVCNADPSQAHGFQIEHYYDDRLVSLAPGQVLKVSFMANEAGTFRVYCEILCSVHWAMQNGQLIIA